MLSHPHRVRVRVLAHIKKPDDCFRQFLVRVVCGCGTCREIGPEALARLVGWSVTLKVLALRIRSSSVKWLEDTTTLARLMPL